MLRYIDKDHREYILSLPKTSSEDAVDDVRVMVGNVLAVVLTLPSKMLSQTAHDVPIMVKFSFPAPTGTVITLLQSHILHRMFQLLVLANQILRSVKPFLQSSVHNVEIFHFRGQFVNLSFVLSFYPLDISVICGLEMEIEAVFLSLKGFNLEI